MTGKIMTSEKKTDQERVDEFLKEYRELCQKHKLQLIVTPQWRFSPDGNDFRLQLQEQVIKI